MRAELVVLLPLLAQQIRAQQFVVPGIQYKQGAKNDVLVPTKGNLGGWCKMHGNVACIFEDVDTSTDPVNWKVKADCEQLQMQGDLTVTQLPQATAYIFGQMDDGVIRVQESLRTHKKLRKLGLQNNFIGPAGAAALATALQENYHINVIYLGFNRLGPAGAANLANGIKIQQLPGGTAHKAATGLTELYLDANVLGDVGAGAVADLIRHAGLLRVLSLQANRITDVGATRIKDAVMTTGSLISLNLIENEISKPILDTIATKLEGNCCRVLDTELFYRCQIPCDVEANARGTVCKKNCKQEAAAIQSVYKVAGKCCERLKMTRCV